MKEIADWFLKPFGLLDTVKSRWQLVIFCGVFGCVFLTVFRPFDMEQWFPEAKTSLFIIITFLSAAGMAALALSQFAIRAVFHIQLTTRIGFFAWLLLDFFMTSLATHGVNAIFTGHPLLDGAEYLLTLKYTLLVLVLPYSIGILLLFVQQQLEVVKQLTLKVSRASGQENVTVTDDSGKVVLSTNSRNILYFKSEDNYVYLYYRVEEELKKELIRTTLKKLEQDLNTANFLRIHRSYMINTQNLVAATRTSKGYQVIVDAVSKAVLPVSVTYQEAFVERCVQKSPF